MKKYLKGLFLIPTLLLASCGLGKEITEEESKEISKNIAAEAAKQKDVAFELSMSGTNGKNKEKTNLEYKMKLAENGDKYYYAFQEQGENKAFFEVYQVANETYDEVTWVKYLSEGKEVTAAYAKKGNEITYEASVATFVASASFGPGAFYMMFSSPEIFVSDYVDSQSENATIKYYSNGEKNLSIKATVKNEEKPEDSGDGDEWVKEGSFLVTYDNNLLKSLEVSSTTNLGNKATGKGKASYGAQKISLPKGWEDLLGK